MTNDYLSSLLTGGPYYGKYRGTVTDVDAAEMAIRANVPAVLGPLASGWCAPCVPYAGKDVGFVMLPEVGAGVWIEFEGGDVSKPIWSGCYWRSGETPSDADADVKMIVTKAGKLAFDNNAPSVTLANADEHQLTLDGDGAKLACDPKNVAVSTSSVSVNDGALEVT